MHRNQEERYRELCRLYSQALQAIEKGDLEGAAARGDEAGRLVAEIEADHPGTAVARGTPAEQARTLHGQVMAALEEGRERTAAELGRTKQVRKALDSYRETCFRPGRRLDIPDA